MKIPVKDMREALKVSIQGDEAWLAEIYASFLGNEGRGIQGEVVICPEPYGVYSVKGQISYVPKVSCSRCELAIPWPIERAIDVRFIDRDGSGFEIEGDDEESDEGDLTPEDLDTYYLGNEGEIDLEMIVNDLVQTAIPTRTIALSADGKSCAICLEDVAKPLVFEDGNKEDQSPFAVLKNLKLPDA